MAAKKELAAKCGGAPAGRPANSRQTSQGGVAGKTEEEVRGIMSQKRTIANRRNARRSTGPRTKRGKAVTAWNALKHGLQARQVVIPGEKRKDFQTFQKTLMDDLAPEGALEILLAERIVAANWRLRRSLRVEAEMIYHRVDLEQALMVRYPENYQLYVPLSIGNLVWDEFEPRGSYENFRRYEAHIERGMYRALHELQRLQMARKGRRVPAPAVLDVNVSRTAA